ncbi:MAG: histidine kinase [Candidatus Limnocylindrales bacterium]
MSTPEPPRAPATPPVGEGRSDATGGRPPVPGSTEPDTGHRLAPGFGLGQSSISGLRREIEEDIRRIEGENGEIDMLMEQVLLEIERHESRRAKMESRLSSLETSSSPDLDELTEVRDGLLALTRRELLFDAQRQVLEGKQRVLARFLQRLVEIDNSLSQLGGAPTRPAPVASAGLRALAAAAGGSGGPGLNQPAIAMRSQEDLRRDIVRQLHDGPAQSIANIGLQVEIVDRLLQKGDPRVAEEVKALTRLVQQALDTTKEFIFEIRPMVLDDLGLGPTVRRTASDRGRRSGINIDFDSQGIEERLDPDIESAVYRSIDEAIVGFLALRPPSVLVRLDWGERELVATVEGTWPRVNPEGQSEASEAAAARSVDTPPALLAMMQEKRSADQEADRATRALPPDRVREIGNRARALGMTLTLRDEGQAMELVAPIGR